MPKILISIIITSVVCLFVIFQTGYPQVSEENLDDESKQKLIEVLSEECGGPKPHFKTDKPHLMFVTYDEKKISLHDIPVIAMKHGMRVDIVG